MEEKQRLIDANDVWKGTFICDEVAEVRKLIEDATTVDAVPVVRCNDCIHFVQEEHGCNHFGYYSHIPWVDEVDFCSYGERKK